MARLKRDAKGLRIKTGICVECKMPRKRLNHYGVCSDCRAEAHQTRQEAYKNAVHDLDTDISIPGRLEILHSQGGYSWRFLSGEMSKGKRVRITPADLSRLARGKEPKAPMKRQALGLPVQQLAPVCTYCGRVHVTKRCAQKWQSGPRRLRLVAQVTEAEYNAVKSAAEREGVTMAEYIRRILSHAP